MIILRKVIIELIKLLQQLLKKIESIIHGQNLFVVTTNKIAADQKICCDNKTFLFLY